MLKSVTRVLFVSVTLLAATTLGSLGRMTSPIVHADTAPSVLLQPPASESQVTSASNSSPSGQAMPVGDLPGWHQIFADDFTTDVPTGSFPGSVYRNTWYVYPDGAHDTSGNGQYYPSKVLSVSNGMLNMYLHTENGIHMVAAVLPKLPTMLYGRYTVRFRADSLYGYKSAWLLWPDSGNFPYDGEIDFPESCTGLDGLICAFMHRMYATSNLDRDYYSTGATYGAWHTATTEWSPGNVTFYLDGQVIGTSTNRVPSDPMHWVLQTETSTYGEGAPSNSTAGNVQIDWVAAYSMTGVGGGTPSVTETCSGGANPTTSYRGWVEHLGTWVTSNQSISGALVSFEVYNSAGAKVYQTAVGPVTLAANSGQWLTGSWAIPSTQPTGTYTVKVLVFGPNWTPLYSSNSSCASFTVS